MQAFASTFLELMYVDIIDSNTFALNFVGDVNMLVRSSRQYGKQRDMIKW